MIAAPGNQNHSVSDETASRRRSAKHPGPKLPGVDCETQNETPGSNPSLAAKEAPSGRRLDVLRVGGPLTGG